MKSLAKGFLASFVQFIGLIIGGMVAGFLGLTAPALPVEIDQTLIMLLFIVVGVCVSVPLGELFRQLNQGFTERFSCIFLFNFMVQHILQILEQIIFTTTVNPLYHGIMYFFASVLMSLVIAILWKPDETDSSLRNEWSNFFSRREKSDWLWRVVVSWLAYLAIYYLVGHLISPIVQPFYTDPAFGESIGLILPSVPVIVSMQILRGGLFLGVVFPILILWRRSRKTLWVWLGISLAMQIVPNLLMGYWLPITLQVVHGIELTVDSFAQSFVYAYLLYKD